MSLFANVPLAPRDPILGLNEAYAADPRSNKVNLGVGVYYDDNGKIPLLACVREAETAMAANPKPRGYQPIEGPAHYTTAVQHLLFGPQSPLLAEKRVVTAQGLGGTGALRIGADLLKRIVPDASVYISAPSWENHRGIFEAAGFSVREYRYFDAQTGGVDFAGMIVDLEAAPAHSIIVLHACSMPAATTPPAPISPKRNGKRSSKSVEPKRSFPSSTWPTKASPKGSTPTRLPCAASAMPGFLS